MSDYKFSQNPLQIFYTAITLSVGYYNDDALALSKSYTLAFTDADIIQSSYISNLYLALLPYVTNWTRDIAKVAIYALPAIRRAIGWSYTV